MKNNIGHQPMNRSLNGNQAVAWAAACSGISYFSHYPGSPVNFVEPSLKKIARDYELDIHFNDALNEHIAALSAAGASFCGARSMVVMKHVGLNIAADPFNYIGYSGVKGGMVIVVGTDPGANTSTGEEDIHWYIPQFNFPAYEPVSVQGIFNDIKEAYEVSEKYQIPVMVLIPVRICNSIELVSLSEPEKIISPGFHFQKDREKYINVGQRAVSNHRKLLDKIKLISENLSKTSTFFNKESKVAFITRGLTFSLFYEAVQTLGLQDEVTLLNIESVYPLPAKIISKFLENKQELIIIEDQDGFLEMQIKMHLFNEIKCTITGKEVFPAYGEIDYSQVFNFLALKFRNQLPQESGVLPNLSIPERLGSFCEGCPHTSSFFAIDQSFKEFEGIIGGDIGCSSLPPFRADWLLCMNSGIGISQGMAQVLENQIVVSTGGDGSFFHAGIISLLNAIVNKIDLIHIVFDNKVNAMTGHQPSPSSFINHTQLLNSIGVDRIIEINGHDPLNFSLQLKAEYRKKGVRVFWVKSPCVFVPDEVMMERKRTLAPVIHNEHCNDCMICYEELACPAINKTDLNGRNLFINLDKCIRCGACSKVCPNGAIEVKNVLQNIDK